MPLVFISRVPPKGYEVSLNSFPKKQPPHFERLLQFIQGLECSHIFHLFLNTFSPLLCKNEEFFLVIQVNKYSNCKLLLQKHHSFEEKDLVSEAV